MRVLALIILGILIFLYINLEIASMNPCSNFSHEQSLCNSDNKVDNWL